jgi:LysM repeat protein
MPRLLTRLALLAAAWLLPAAVHAQPVGNGLYVVQAGDTLFRIARSNELTVEALQALNQIQDNRITVGQTLRLNDRVTVPAGGVAPPRQPERPRTPVPTRPTPERPTPVPTQPTPERPTTPAAGAVHIVEPGETLFRIALRYNTSVAELRRLNTIEGDQIQVGQRLAVGGGAATAGGPRPARITPPRQWSITNTTVPADLVHYVEPGETLYSIAAALGMEVSDLTSANALSTAPLEPGTLLYLPEAVDPAAAIARTLPEAEDAGLAIVYPDVMRGRETTSGERYDPLALTASHREYPMGTVLLVTNPVSGRSTFVRVIDRGPVSQTYLLELSAAAATALDLDPNAARRVELREVR